MRVYAIILLLLLAVDAINQCTLNGIAIVHPLAPYIECDPRTGRSIVVGRPQTFLDVNEDGIDDSPCLETPYPFGTPCGSNETCSFWRCDGAGTCALPPELLHAMYARVSSDVRVVVIVLICTFAITLLTLDVWLRTKI